MELLQNFLDAAYKWKNVERRERQVVKKILESNTWSGLENYKRCFEKHVTLTHRKGDHCIYVINEASERFGAVVILQTKWRNSEEEVGQQEDELLSIL